MQNLGKFDSIFTEVHNQSAMQFNEFQQKNITYILVCAWCNKDDNPPLAEHEEYTHGICQQHKQLFLAKSKTLSMTRILA